jgi:hypothetical protein
MHREYFECGCECDEHRLVFSLDVDNDVSGSVHPDNVCLYTSVFLNQYHGVFGRIWVAIKYIFGVKCRYGHFDCFLLKSGDIDRMTEMLNNYQQLRSKYTSTN